MDDKKAVIDSTNKNSALSRFQQKNWVKKLEVASGKPVLLRKSDKIVYLLVDCSGSMEEGSKMAQAKKGTMALPKKHKERDTRWGSFNLHRTLNTYLIHSKNL